MKNILKGLSLPDRVQIQMRMKRLTYDAIIPKVNELLPNTVTPVKNRSELSRAINRGFVTRGNRGQKNNAMIQAVICILELEVD